MAYAKYYHIQESAYGSILRSLTEKKIGKHRERKGMQAAWLLL